jgi:hypothetical protein
VLHLARALLLADAVTPEALAEALVLAATQGTSLPRGLIGAHAIDGARLEQFFETYHEGAGAPLLVRVTPLRELAASLPPGLCERLQAVPVRRDPLTGTVDVAVVDARDAHASREVAHFLKAPVRTVRTSLGAMEAALVQVHAERVRGVRALAPLMGLAGAFEAPTSTPSTPEVEVAIPLTRRNTQSMGAAVPVPRAAAPELRSAELQPEIRIGVMPEGEPVIDLRKRKLAAPATVRGPFTAEAPPLPPPPPAPAPAPVPAPAPAPAPALARPAPAPAAAPTLAPTPPRAPSPSHTPAHAPSRAPPARTPTNPPPRPAALDSRLVLAEMATATDRDQILDLLITGARVVARQVAVLAVRKDALTGWACSPEFANRDAMRGVKLPNTAPTILHEALDHVGARLARLPKDERHAPLLAVMDSAPPYEVALVAVHAVGKPVAILLAHDLDDSRESSDRIAELARGAGAALERLLRERRK